MRLALGQSLDRYLPSASRMPVPPHHIGTAAALQYAGRQANQATERDGQVPVAWQYSYSSGWGTSSRPIATAN